MATRDLLAEATEELVRKRTRPGDDLITVGLLRGMVDTDLQSVCLRCRSHIRTSHRQGRWVDPVVLMKAFVEAGVSLRLSSEIAAVMQHFK